jgi:hypothetical protein
MNYLFYTLLFASGALNIVLLYYIVKFGRIILGFETKIEFALDELDQTYSSIGEILSMPLYSDNPEIVRIYNLLQSANSAVLSVASQIGRIEEVDAEEEE